MSLELRPYQQEIVARVRSLMRRGIRRILLESPTGSGKTCLTAAMLSTSASKSMRSWFVVHRRELVNQSSRTFRFADVAHGVVAAGYLADPRPLVQVCGVQTLGRRHARLEPPRLIVWDECHHIAAASWAEIFAAYPDAFHIGLTATPERLDGRGLNQFFDCMVRGPSVAWLIEQGYLSPYRLFAPARPQLEGVHSRAGDYARNELAAVMDRPKITGDALEHYQRLAPVRRALVRCVSILHSQHVVEQFQAAGVPAMHVDGETDARVRDDAVRAFERGDLRVLSNVDLFSEGFDLPAIEVAIDLRPTESLTLWLQFCGRALRTSEGKTEALILDHAGNAARHGLPDDEREWSLLGRRRGKRAGGEQSVAIRECPQCYATNPAVNTTCFACGHVFAGAPREVLEVAGELAEVDKAAARRVRLREQARAETLDDLIALGRSRGYKAPEAWARHLFEARKGRAVQREVA